MTEDMRPMLETDPMTFHCCAQNSCFNECCRDLNQALTPYDILRLKRGLGISSQAFIRQYTSLHHGPESGLPILTFKPNPATGHQCPFVTQEGCSVYGDRPGSCRLYPLARAISRSRKTNQITPYFALIEEPHCQGFGRQTSPTTVAQWLEGQNVADHNQHNDKLMELISLKNQILPGPLEGALADQFYLGLYDLDEFRDQIFSKGVVKELCLSDAVLSAVKTDDEALLDLGIAWVRYRLFGRDFKLEG